MTAEQRERALSKDSKDTTISSETMKSDTNSNERTKSVTGTDNYEDSNMIVDNNGSDRSRPHSVYEGNGDTRQTNLHTDRLVELILIKTGRITISRVLFKEIEPI